MPDSETTLVDTSVAVALVVVDHEAHEMVMDRLAGLRLGMAGHAWFETFSVLTRLPGPLRRDVGVVAELLDTNFPDTRFLGSRATASLANRLAIMGVAGGAVYDALVGATAAHHGLDLATRDERALGTYRALDVALHLVV